MTQEMTREEFFKWCSRLVPEFGFKPRLTPNGMIHLWKEGNRYCPITAVCLVATDEKIDPRDVRFAVVKLGISHLRDTIITATDQPSSLDQNEKEVREALLTSLGLEERAVA